MNNQLHFKRYLVLIAVLVTVLFATVPVSAASKATKNKKAVALYEQKAGKLKQLYSKKYIDITGDGIKEGIFLYKPIGAGGYIFNFQILTYQKGKVKKLYKSTLVHPSKMIIYKKSKSFIVYGIGSGVEMYDYYRFDKKNKKYKHIAEKNRLSYGRRKGPWDYYSKRKISKEDFKNLTKGINTGKKKKIAFK